MADVIDIHGHGVPPALIDEARLRGGSYGGIRVEGSDDSPVFTFPGANPLRPLIPGMADGVKRRQWLAGNGIAAQLVAPWLDVQGSDLDPEPGERWTSFVNEAMVQWCQESDGALFPLASLHLADPAAAARELRRAVALGCVGAMIPTHQRYGSIGVAGWEPLWEVIQDEQVPIILHPQLHGPTCLAGQKVTLGFRSLWGRPMDTTILAEELLLHGLFERFPGARVVLVHGGGYLPYQAGRLDGEVATGRVTSSLRGLPSAQIGRFFFDTVLMSSWAISLLVSSYGAEHVVMGSDYPFFAKVLPPGAELAAAALDDSAKAAVNVGSARRLFPRLRLSAEQELS